MALPGVIDTADSRPHVTHTSLTNYSIANLRERIGFKTIFTNKKYVVWQSKTHHFFIRLENPI
jgi:hypothetical protein